MNNYELTLIVDPEKKKEETKKIIDGVKKIIEGLKGKVEKVDKWGKIDFAYRIGKLRRGNYFLLSLTLPTAGAEKINEKLKHKNEIIRYLLIKAD